MNISQLHQAIEAKTARLGVIGLGYVGLPVAAMFAKVGFEVVGVDIDPARIEAIERNENPIKGIEPGMEDLLAEVNRSGRLCCTTDYAKLRAIDVVTIAVQTPVENHDHKPRYEHLKAVLRELGAVLKPGALVIVESTLAPGTMQRAVIPALRETAGDKLFYVGHCPERVMPGRLLHNITKLDRVVGGETPEVAAAMVALYRHVVEGTLDPTDLLSAEIVKTVENAYRDVQIAFANEVARVCEALGGDVWRVRELVNKSPGRNMHYPGAGVGGHCIPKDSWLLIANVEGFEPQLLPTARAVNRAMPGHVMALLEDALDASGAALRGASVAVLGYSYRENTDDTRDTPSQAFIELVEKAGARVRIHDPYVPPYQVTLDEVLSGADSAVIMVAHNEYVQTDWAVAVGLLNMSILVDARHVLPDDFRLPGAQVRVLGKGRI